MEKEMEMNLAKKDLEMNLTLAIERKEKHIALLSQSNKHLEMLSLMSKSACTARGVFEHTLKDIQKELKLLFLHRKMEVGR